MIISAYIPGQSFSSSPLEQSCWPSQMNDCGIHSPSSQICSSSLQIWTQFCSSDPSIQSSCPSHFQYFGIHCPLLHEISFCLDYKYKNFDRNLNENLIFFDEV